MADEARRVGVDTVRVWEPELEPARSALLALQADPAIGLAVAERKGKLPMWVGTAPGVSAVVGVQRGHWW